MQVYVVVGPVNSEYISLMWNLTISENEGLFLKLYENN